MRHSMYIICLGKIAWRCKWELGLEERMATNIGKNNGEYCLAKNGLSDEKVPTAAAAYRKANGQNVFSI